MLFAGELGNTGARRATWLTCVSWFPRVSVSFIQIVFDLIYRMNFASNPDERGSSPEDASYTDSVMMDSINEANESSSKAPVSDDEDDVVDTAGPLPPFLKSPTPTERVKDGKPISLLRIFVIGSLISGAVLAVIFLMNAIVMIFGFYNLYVSFLNTMDIASIKVSGLDTLKANVSFLSSFQPGYLAQLVKFSVDKPVRLQILIPDFIHKSTRNPPIATIVIPAFKLERAQSELAFESVTFHINENIPVNDIIKWYQSREESNKYLKIRGDIPVSTWSFLFPFQYTYHYDGMIPLSSSSLKKSGPPVASIESLEFFDNKQDEDTLRADVGIKISSKVFPKYLSFDLPSFQFGVNHFLDLQYASEFLQVCIVISFFFYVFNRFERWKQVFKATKKKSTKFLWRLISTIKLN
jgi:hypothetical protein